jgi:predicted RNA-binding Zn-ribbon protein involved in translation (DUF1610 family)
MTYCPTTGKIIYRSVRETRSAIHGIWYKKHYPLKRYICPHCGYYHLTTEREPHMQRIIRLIDKAVAA